MLRRKLALAGAAALVSALALAMPAPADHGSPPPVPSGFDDSYGRMSCEFSGLTGHAPAPVQSVAVDLAIDDDAWDPANLLDTDGGQFTLDGEATCTAADIAGNDVGAVVTTFDIHGEGHFTNLICGTTDFDGWIHMFAPADGSELTFRFGMRFVAGAAANTFEDTQFTINHLDGYLVLALPIRAPQDIDDGRGTGAASIVPVVGGCGAGPGVTAFAIHGFFGASFSGDTANNNTSPNG